MLFIHDHPDAGISAERLRTLLDEMAAVAKTIETGIVLRLLAGQTTPPEEMIGKYAPWIIGLGLTFGLPAIMCICVMAFGFLGF